LLEKKGSKRNNGMSPHSARESGCSENVVKKLRLNSSKTIVSIGHLSLNSVTDEYYIAAQSESEQS
jgi:hypothetical protein